VWAAEYESRKPLTAEEGAALKARNGPAWSAGSGSYSFMTSDQGGAMIMVGGHTQ